MQCVLEVLRGNAVRRGAGSGAIALVDWQDALRVAEEEHVLPIFAARVRESGAAIPDPLQAELAAADRDGALSSFWWTNELKGVLAAFAAKSLPVIPLKGPWLAERLYGDVGLRVYRDLDLLVRRTDFDAAGALLTQLGFVPHARPDDYHQPWRRGTTSVELHFDVENPLAFNLDMPGAWKRAMPGLFQGQAALHLASADELLFLCLHGVRHRYQRLSHVLDVAFALDRFGPQLGAELHLPPSTQKHAHLILLGQRMAARLEMPLNLNIRVPVSARSAAHMERLAGELWASLLEAPGVSLDWQAQHRFYLRTEPASLRRSLKGVQHLRILASRLIESDYAFAARFGIRQSGLVWILRQLRLLTRSDASGS